MGKFFYYTPHQHIKMSDSEEEKQEEKEEAEREESN